MYPYNLFRKTIIGASVDSKGNAVGGNPVWTKLIECRDRKGSSKEQQDLNGVSHQVTAIIYCPRECPALNSGEEIEVREDDGTVRLRKKVILYSREMFHCRIWV